MLGPDWLRARLESLCLPPSRRRLLLAYSGGLDSTVLLHLLATLRDAGRGNGRPGWELRAVHVHHHLQPDADRWAQRCRAQCRALDVPFLLRHVRLPSVRGVSLEAAARDARYAALASLLGPDEVLLTAHHEDDQFETLLLQLMRGAGLAGLAAMPEFARFGNAWIARPLLNIERGALETWAKANGVDWVEDPSNRDLRFDRNFIRHEIAPRLRARWPAAAAVASRSARHLADARELLDALGSLDLVATAPDGSLEIDALAALTAARQRNLVRHWITRRGLPLPDERHLARILTELPAARVDAMPEVAWPGGAVRRYRGRLYCVPPLSAARGERAWPWRQSAGIDLGPGVGRLVLTPDATGPIALARLPARLTLRWRKGGERMQLRASAPRRALKDLLREAAVLPWQRSRLPLIYAGARLIAVADVLTDASVLAGPRTRARGRIVWQP